MILATNLTSRSCLKPTPWIFLSFSLSWSPATSVSRQRKHAKYHVTRMVTVRMYAIQREHVMRFQSRSSALLSMVHAHRAFQNGGYSHPQRPSPPRRLASKSGSEGCILCDPNPPLTHKYLRSISKGNAISSSASHLACHQLPGSLPRPWSQRLESSIKSERSAREWESGDHSCGYNQNTTSFMQILQKHERGNPKCILSQSSTWHTLYKLISMWLLELAFL